MESATHSWWNLGYYGIFACVFAEQIGLPIPALPLLVAAGALIASHELNLWASLLTAVGAAVLADVIWYAIGRAKGATVLNLMCRISWKPDTCISKTKVIFSNHGTKMLVFAKFIPGLSSLTPPMAGLSRIPWGRFLFYDALGALIWAMLPLVAGSYIEQALSIIVTHAARLKGDWPWACAAVIAGVLAWRYRNRRRYVAELNRGRAKGIAVADLKARLDRGEPITVLDARDATTMTAESVLIPAAVWIPYVRLPSRLAALPLDKPLVVYCDCPEDQTAVAMADYLTTQGAREARPLLGGIDAWRAQGWPTEPWRAEAEAADNAAALSV
ncbi:membrane protein DedA, SNARE-associated domain [Verrucomicrobium sp. GAS474]|uniref:VTT domain-containing protein n=1 Tax=Verrucomicrobium sp. GAS474 TaxID=1882831 RepID=UPI00087C35A9|nr:VTT domain-containing protein [Verrucomicrobium sp. GAS474]SDT91964.1 membrane protein DedA, SNARE-associated domain [Verrucomicrobium sp. GAS474]